MTTKAADRTEPRSGFYSSEFFTTVAIIICATILRGLGSISDEMWGLVAFGQGAVYTGGRVVTKVNQEK